MRNKLLVSAALLLAYVYSPQVVADQDGERAVLARLTHEINSLIPLIDEAESQSNLSGRYKFQYQWLKSDLNIVRSAIEDHIHGSRVEPRVVQPLKGDYIR